MAEKAASGLTHGVPGPRRSTLPETLKTRPVTLLGALGGLTTSLFFRVSTTRVRLIQIKSALDEQRSGRLYSSQIEKVLVRVEPCLPRLPIRQDSPHEFPEPMVVIPMPEMAEFVNTAYSKTVLGAKTRCQFRLTLGRRRNCPRCAPGP